MILSTSVGAPPRAESPLWPHFDLGPAPGVRLAVEPALAFTRDHTVLTLGTVPPACLSALRALAAGRLTRVERRGGTGFDRLAMTAVLDLLDARGWLSYLVAAEPAGAEPAMVAWPRGRPDGQSTAPGQQATTYCGQALTHCGQTATHDGRDDQLYQLSRLCFLRPSDGAWVAVSPTSGFEVEVRDVGLWPWLSRFARPHRPSELFTDGEHAQAYECWRLLVGTGLITPIVPGDEAALHYWEFHDLLFHTESREGFRRKPFGGTYRFDSPQPMPDAARFSGDALPLATPAPAEYPHGHLFRVLDERRSLRPSGGTPCTVDQLGEFLYRCARTTTSARTDYGQIRTRPYPSGGAIHELSLYLLVHEVQGLAAGIYRYDAEEHALPRLDVAPARLEKLLDDSAIATLRTDPPDVLVVITAQFPRLAWKYEGIAYALVLKHVGVLMQTMYLVATAMNLAPCAVGGGDSTEFARVTGLNPFAEPAVGEFTLGAL